MKLMLLIPLAALTASYTSYPANTAVSTFAAFTVIAATALALFRLWQLQIYYTCIIDARYASAVFTANVANLVWLVAIQYQFDLWLLCIVIPLLLGIRFVAKQLQTIV